MFKIKSIIPFVLKLRSMHIPVLRYVFINRKRFIKHVPGKIFPRVDIEFNCQHGGELILHGDVEFGVSRFSRKVEKCKVYLGVSAKMILDGGQISEDCDIEVFDHARLSIGSSFYSNLGLIIVCAKNIQIGTGVNVGRDVIIRDTNGGHYILRDGYENAREVVIGNHVWLCDRCEILPGVHIGEGSIVAAGAVVTKDVPPHSLIAGVPGRVIKSNVNWK